MAGCSFGAGASAPNGGRERWGAAGAVRLVLGSLVVGAASAAPAASDKVRVTGLSDVAFGTIANLTADSVQRQDVCLFSNSATNGYNVTAVGSGPGGAFELSGGAAALPFDVLWSSAAGATGGTKLDPNVALPGQASSATHQSCSTGPASSASLIIVVRAASLSSATAGSYSGLLTFIVGPE